MHNTTTTHELTPSELERCRENLRKQWNNHKVDEALLRRAWDDAHRVATLLYKKYGATKVAVFGSLADRVRFSKDSDIDIVVWGVSYNRCLDALWETEGLSSEFKIDIINVKTINKLFRKRILNEAIPIDIVETDSDRIIKETDGTENSNTSAICKLNREKLIQRINDEQDKIERTIRSITEALHDLDVIAEHHKKYIEKTIATEIVDVYSCIERIFQQIVSEVDKYTPSGEKWHTDLLDQMTEHKDIRPQVISLNTVKGLKQLLKFRHRLNNIYKYELIFPEVEKHAKQVATLYDSVSEELTAFITFLNET